MSEINFTVVINLSNFFNDHRSRARIFINNKIKIVQDLQNKITKVFGIENFVLTSNNEFLPSSEDIRILRSDDIIWVIPHCVHNLENKESHIDTCSLLDVDTYSPKKKQKRKRKYSQCPDANIQDTNIQEYENKSSRKRDKKIENPNKISKETTKLNGLDEEHPSNVESSYSKKKDKNNSKIYQSTKNLPQTGKMKVNDLDQENHINVGSSLPNDISYKKIIPIPTITDEYLKEKKINIVKIDYIRKPSVQNEEKIVSAEKENGNEEIQKQENEPCVYDKQISLPEPDPSRTFINQQKKTLFHSDSEICKNKETNKNYLDQYNHKLSISVPTTKYFFLNTPTSKEKKPVVKQKKENLFKLKKYTLSPIATNIVDENIPETPVDLPNNEDKDDAKNKNETYNVSKMNQNVLQNSFKSNNISTKDNINVDEEKMELDNEIKCDDTKGEDNCQPPIFIINPTSNHSLNDWDVPKKNVEDDKIQQSSLVTNDSITEQISNFHNNPVLEETKLADEFETYSECKNVEVENETVDVKHKLPGFGKLSTAILQDSYYLNKISPCIETLLESKGEQFEISGLEPLKSWKENKISGVGSLLNNLRKSDMSGADESPAVSDLSEFVTKRRRIRTRKRQKNKTNQQITIEQTSTPASTSFKPPKSAAAPKMHIKFSENDKNESDEEMTDDEGGNDASIISLQSEKEGILDWNKKILESPVMSGNQLPRINDIIAFKVLKISEDFTPGISSFIIGRVHNFSAETKCVTFEIVHGLGELKTPQGKFSIHKKNDPETSSTYKEFYWSELVQPTLLFP